MRQHLSFTFLAEEHLHDSGIVLSILVALETPPESPDQLEEDVTFLEVLPRLHDQFKHGGVSLVGSVPDELLLRTPQSLYNIEFAMKFWAPLDRGIVLAGEKFQPRKLQR
jgi:hypothetical protein